MRITISIPKPCQEDWQAMTPDAVSTTGKGRHCAQCDHVVADLTQATDAQLVALFTSDAKPKCARFDPAQLNRALGTAEAPRQAGALPVAAFTTLAAVASGCESIGQQPPLTTIGEMEFEPAIEQPVNTERALLGDTVAISTPMPPETIDLMTGQSTVIIMEGLSVPECTKTAERTTKGETKVDPILEHIELGNVSIRLEEVEILSTMGGPGIAFLPEVPDTMEVCGTVVDHYSGEPLPFAHIWSDDLNAHTTTDAHGAFRFRLARPAEKAPVTIEVRSPGYLLEKHLIDPAKPVKRPAPPKMVTDPLTGGVDPHDPMGITGAVVDRSGAQVPGLVIRVRGTAVRVQCDTDGKFFLSVPEQLMGKSVTLDVLDADRVLKSIPLSERAVPCCVPVSLSPEEMPTPPAPADQCQDVGVIRMRERQMLTGMVAISPEPMRRDTLDRLLRPVKDVMRKRQR